jgi:SAM-dependent methyltransferase
MTKKIGDQIIEDFGKEWQKFNQRDTSEQDLKKMFADYFHIVPKKYLSKESICFDMGAGSGRWARFVAEKVKRVDCIEPSNLALNEAKKFLSKNNNCHFFKEEVLNNSLKNNYYNFGYSLGVLHHIIDTEKAVNECISKIKPGGAFLIYLYYNFDNKAFSFRIIWKITDFIRNIVSRLPFIIKYFISQIIALFIYFPLARMALIAKKLKLNDENIPLNYYSDKSFKVMRLDSLDRFGTRLEKRFTKMQIKNMLEKSGLKNIKFSNRRPFWVAIGFKKKIK